MKSPLKSVSFLALSSVSLLFASCAQWNATQKASLSTVAVAPIIEANAYQKPYGKSSLANVETPVIVGNGLTSLLVGTVTTLSGKGIGAVQQNMYEKSNADAINKASNTVPSDLKNRICKTVGKELNTNSFFRDKVRDKSPNILTVTVNAYGYVRDSKSDGKILMTPRIAAVADLVDTNTKKTLLSQKVLGISSTTRPLEDFANNKKLASDAFDQAIQSMAVQISDAVKAKAE